MLNCKHIIAHKNILVNTFREKIFTSIQKVLFTSLHIGDIINAGGEKMTIGEKIKKIRTNAGKDNKKLSQEDFAKSLDLSRIAVALYESGDRTPSNKVLKNICQVYHIDIDWLLNGDGDIVYIDTITTLVDSLRATYKLDDLGASILKSYLDLDDDNKKVLEKFIKNIAKGLD